MEHPRPRTLCSLLSVMEFSGTWWYLPSSLLLRTWSEMTNLRLPGQVQEQCREYGLTLKRKKAEDVITLVEYLLSRVKPRGQPQVPPPSKNKNIKQYIPKNLSNFHKYVEVPYNLLIQIWVWWLISVIPKNCWESLRSTCAIVWNPSLKKKKRKSRGARNNVSGLRALSSAP